MAIEKCTGRAKRSDIAQIAAGQIERICLAFMVQSEPNHVTGNDPRPLPPVAVYELAARGRELAIAIMSALGDDVVPTDELQKVLRSTHGTINLRAAAGCGHD